ncbi:MAG: nitrous oxide reductase accessory protein NosL [Halarcobacter sp.]
MKKISLLVISACLFSTLNLSANETYTMNFDKETRGLMRKLPVYKDPAWVCKIVTKDSKEFFFTSPKSLMEFYYNPEKRPSTKVSSSEEIKDIIVTDYKTLKPIDAKYAFYVYGSHKISFAGDDLPAFENINDAKKFLEMNNGRRVLNFNELSKGLIQLLNGDI